MEHSNDDITTLGAKLDALELTHGERAVLDALITTGDDVTGHSDLSFGIKIGNTLNVDVAKNPISGTDLGSSRISGTDLGSSRISGTDLGSSR